MPSPTSTFTLSNFPSWHSTPALAPARPSSLLMAFDKGISNRELATADDTTHANAHYPDLSVEDDGGCQQSEATHPVVRIRPASRPRSFLHVLENFQEENSQVTPSPTASHSSTDEPTVIPQSSNLLFPNDSAASCSTAV